LLHQAVKASAAGIDLFRRPPPGVVVLIYHRVGNRSGLDVDQPLELFDEQMAALAESGGVVRLTTALDALAHGSPDGTKVVVTFDDGTADFADLAVPVLVRHAIPATLYLATMFTEENRAYPDGGRPVSWAGLADACATGLVDVGSHTHRHALLDRMAVGEVADELDRSTGLIGDRLGRPVHDFAYPKAVAPAAHAEELVRARFRSAALGGTRVNRIGATDPYRLARSPVQRSDGMRWFRRKVAGGMRLEDDLRRLLNRRRYARATT
jgi:peptidoglycan/xylan/chitin deacetylase (PgdA/CDA1 family)